MKYAPLMRSLRPGSVLFGLALLCAGCGQRQVEIIGAIPDGASVPVPCPPTLAERVTVADIPVDKNIAWQKAGYDHFPVDERVALAVQPDGQAQIAWLEVHPDTAAGGPRQAPIGVHVTPLDAILARRGPDVLLPTGQEVSGLVAHEDGFALLTRDLNPGTAIDLGDGATVAFLLRYQNGQERYRVPLSGSKAEDAAEIFTLYSPFLEGQLVWNGSTYGAYFAVRGGVGDPQEGLWRDALVFRDSLLGAAPWTVAHGCVNNGGIRLIPDQAKANLVPNLWTSLPDITGLCVQQARPGIKLTSLEANRPVSDQETQVPGFSGAKLGSLLKIADGYLVFWLSLGDTSEADLHQGDDIRMARLDASFNVVSGPTWITRTPGVQEWNLHVAPYGPAHFLMIYEEITITGSAEDNWAMYLGNYRGTHLVLLDANGLPIPDTDQLVPGVAVTANAEPVLLPGGDVAWPFVNPTPDYTTTVAPWNGPGQTTLHIARVRYCL
jgi:hypothetical protein